MSRPTKTGLDYFNLDCNMDDEVDLIVAEHGSKGFHILIKLFQVIYGNKGYYIEWNKRNQLLLSKKVSVNRNLVTSVVSDCLEWGIFNSNLYQKHNVLSSTRIQKQYISATYKRSRVKVIENYLLIEKPDRKNITYIEVSDVKNSDTTGDNDNNCTQSKVKESKVKKSKATNNNVRDSKSQTIENNSYLPNMIFHDLPIKYKKIANRTSEEDYELAASYHNYQSTRFKMRNLGIKKDLRGADTIRLLQQSDGYEIDEIENALKWCLKNDFWSQNIKSIGAVRKKNDGEEYKFDNMFDKYNNSEQKSIKIEGNNGLDNSEYHQNDEVLNF